jgi:glucose/arabinose dehydrogenase
MNLAKIISVVSLLLFTIAVSNAQPHDELIRNLRLPDGFKLSVFADQLPNARSLALGENDMVYIGSGAEGKVYAVEDNDHNGKADTTYTLAEGLNMPNGVAYKDGALYVAEINRIIRYDDISKHLTNPPKPAVVYDQFPSDKHHGWKYLRFGPDGKLYTAVGAPCNICKPPNPVYASLVRLNQDGSQFEIIVSGIRNTVGFDWQPGSNSLFFNDNGRDWLGDDAPPEELNQWSGKIGEDFGFPYCHGGKISDPEFGHEKACRQFTAPVWTYNAHNAPLGMRFYQGRQFPAAYSNQLFVALHGSWNRSKPDGYQVVLVKFKDGKPVAQESFISGWLSQDDKASGRPVDILEMPDGSLLISDDQNGLIYRIEYRGKK